MNWLHKTVQDFLSISPEQPLETAYGQTVENIHQLCAGITRHEAEGLAKQAILEMIRPLRDTHAQSALIRHTQNWPKGYPGDYECVEYLLSRKNRAKPHTLEYLCEEYILKGPISQQHRNKLKYQADLILETLSQNMEREKKILSIASNSSWDLWSIQHLIADANGVFYLNDHDSDALDYAQQRLGQLRQKCRLIEGNFIRAMKKMVLEAPFDLVTLGGLCDYLNDRQLTNLIGRAYHQLLAAGGKLYLTNIGKHNPYRPWMEYVANWQVVERTEADIQRIVSAANCPLGALKIQREATGLTLLAEIVK